MHSASVAIRRSFLALNSNWITCTSSSAGAETHNSYVTSYQPRKFAMALLV